MRLSSYWKIKILILKSKNVNTKLKHKNKYTIKFQIQLVFKKFQLGLGGLHQISIINAS